MFVRIFAAIALVTSVGLTACGGGSNPSLPASIANAPNGTAAASARRSTASATIAWDKKSTLMVIQNAPSAAASPTAVASPAIECYPVSCIPTPHPTVKPTTAPTPTPTATPTTVALQVIISVPAPAQQRRYPTGSKFSAIKPDYVSPNTVSAGLVESSPPPGEPASYAANCVTNSDETKTCTLNIVVLPGTQTLTASTYDGANLTDNLLSKAATVVTIQQGVANNIQLALNPVVVEVGFQLTTNVENPVWSLTLSAGTATTFPVTVAGYDPDGNIIPTPSTGSYYLDTTGTPYTVSATVSAPTGAITLPSYTFTSPASPTVTASYSGASLGSGATISASISSSDPSLFVDPPVTISN